MSVSVVLPTVDEEGKPQQQRFLEDKTYMYFDLTCHHDYGLATRGGTGMSTSSTTFHKHHTANYSPSSAATAPSCAFSRMSSWSFARMILSSCCVSCSWRSNFSRERTALPPKRPLVPRPTRPPLALAASSRALSSVSLAANCAS